MSSHHKSPAPAPVVSTLNDPTPIPPPAPAPVVVPDVPGRSADEIQAEADRQRRRFYGTQGGRARTMLTGGSGVTGPISSAVVKLLGNSGA